MITKSSVIDVFIASWINNVSFEIPSGVICLDEQRSELSVGGEENVMYEDITLHRSSGIRSFEKQGTQNRSRVNTDFIT